MARASNRLVSEGRHIGQWLKEQHDTHGHNWPDNDERFAPICVAMSLVRYMVLCFWCMLL